MYDRKRAPEVGDRLTLAVIEICLDLMDKHSAAPAMLDGLLDVPEAFLFIFDFIEERNVVIPW